MTVEPEPTIKYILFNYSAVTLQRPPAELDNLPTIQPIYYSHSWSALLSRTIRQLFPQEEPPIIKLQAPIIKPSYLLQTHPTPLIIL